jgi:carbon-monoxide dehydrogenase small subunit
MIPIRLTLNGEPVEGTVEPRKTLLDFLRVDRTLTGAHAGCEHGVCGACTVIVDGVPVRSCLMLAVQTDGCDVRSVESVAASDGTLHAVQDAMRQEGGLQCGFCSPGIVMTLVSVRETVPDAGVDDYRRAMSGHICRCTGYRGIGRAIERLAGVRTDDDRIEQEAHR